MVHRQQQNFAMLLRRLRSRGRVAQLELYILWRGLAICCFGVSAAGGVSLVYVARLELNANNNYYVCYTVSLLCVFVTLSCCSCVCVNNRGLLVSIGYPRPIRSTWYAVQATNPGSLEGPTTTGRCVCEHSWSSREHQLSTAHPIFMVRGPGDEPRISGKPDYDKG